MKKLSGFDIGLIIAFGVITLLGGVAWWYLSGQLSAAKDEASSAASDFDKYSSHEVYLPTASNQKTLEANIALMKSKLDPLVQSTFQAPGNKLAGVTEEDTVAWKHDLDVQVSTLNTAAKLHGVTVPANFYYGFSRYLNQNPRDEQTAVLTKQLLGIEQIATAFIGAPVRTIYGIRRTYEEDPQSGGNSAKTDPDVLPGNAVTSPGDVYVAYPFEIEFLGTTEAFRKALTSLEKSPYIFVTRSITLQNTALASPKISDLDTIAASVNNTGGGGVLETSPGTVAQQTVTAGPRFLFGNEMIHVKVRLDMIEWKGVSTNESSDNSHHRSGGTSRRGASRQQGAAQ